MKGYFCIFVMPLFFCVSCLYSRTAAPIYTVNKSIRINYGSAILRINGRVGENLYTGSSFDGSARDVNYYDNPVINRGTITKDETKYLSAGEEYTFSVLPTEVVTINIRSLDEDDVEISVFEYSREKKYTIKGTDMMGLLIAFQNR
jgi:hypothetical protein